MADRPVLPPWHADERKLYSRRLRELPIGMHAAFPEGITVTREEGNWRLNQHRQLVAMPEVYGAAAPTTREDRIEKIVDWIIERIKQMPPSDQATPPAPTPAATGRPGGSTHSTAPKPTGSISKKAEFCLQDIEKAGGEFLLEELKYPVLTVDKLIVEKLIEPSGGGKVALTPAGVLWLENRRNSSPSAATSMPKPLPQPSAPEPAAPSPEPVPSAPEAPPALTITPILVPRSEAPSCECENCKSRQLLDLLMTYSPAVREAVEQFQALDATLERIRGV